MAITAGHPSTDLTVPKTQRAAVFEEWGKPVSFVQRPVVQESELKPGQVLVKIMYSGVCHTDLHTARAEWPIMPPAPLVGGHEGAGFVVAIAPGTQSPVKIGQAVGVSWLGSSCLSCEACNRGESYNLCIHFKTMTHRHKWLFVIGNEPICSSTVKTGLLVDGTFQQYAVSYATHVTPIPEAIPLHLAAPILCAGVTAYKAIKVADTLPGDIVVIPGAGGGLGHLAIQYAVNGFGLRVIAIDTALRYLRPGGTLVAVGAPSGAKLEIDIIESIPRNITVKISYIGNREDTRQALDMVARGRVQTACRVEPLGKLPEVFDEMEAGKLAGRVVLDLVGILLWEKLVFADDSVTVELNLNILEEF
ncbi:unnamed protein product [Rhizoctonia solani]|uniref:Enoyl reductase (ER) domain-containing protein n=1 Tax=Rhizoctonia solani TaxID=456999 RepID=A0A8H3CKL8_9AGAM|nr:unnamed protein product [Rhizoctonia solani]